MNTIRFTSKALFVALISTGLIAPSLSATPVLTVLANAASRAATIAQPYASKAMTKAGEIVVKFTPQSILGKTLGSAGLGAVGGAAATKATMKPATQVVPVIVEQTKTVTPSTFAPFVAGAAFGLAIDGGKLAVKGAKKAYNYAFDETTGTKLKKAALAVGATAATAGLAYAGYRFAPSIATLKSAADFIANNKLTAAYQALQIALGFVSYETAKTGLASLTSSKSEETQDEEQGDKAHDSANCRDGACTICRQPSVPTTSATRGVEVLSAEKAQAIYPTMTEGSDRDLGYLDAANNFVNTGNRVKVIAQKPTTVIARSAMGADELRRMNLKKGDVFYTSYRPVIAKYLAEQQ